MTSPRLRVGYVREHFSAPLLQFAEGDARQTFTLVECPSGTGQLTSRLAADEIDIAMYELRAIRPYQPTHLWNFKGSKAYKLIGSFVSTPLNWAVITGTNSVYNEISDLKGTTLGISRLGSGSQTMAYVMALQQGWPTDDLKFQGGHPDRAFSDATNVFLAELTDYVVAFNSEESRSTKNVTFIQDKFGYPKQDIEAWMRAVSYLQDCREIPRNVIRSTLSLLEKAGVVTLPENDFDINDFIEKRIAKSDLDQLAEIGQSMPTGSHLRNMMITCNYLQ